MRRMPGSNAIDDLNARFAIEGIAKIAPGEGGLARLEVSTSAAATEIYLHGAQVTSWKPQGHEDVIFLSRQSSFEDGKAIRGGIPVCFPWFRAKADDPKAPSHGFVRTRAWELKALAQEGDSVISTLSTESDDQSRRLWPNEFRAELRISAGKELKMHLTVINSGMTPFQFEEALHSYHRVGDATKLCISGLDSVAYLDNRDGNRKKIQIEDLVFSEATDNAYLATDHAVEIVDPILKRRIRIEKENSSSTVVWNPWQEGAAALSDLGDDEWREFACVEAANIVASAIHLAPGDRHTMGVVIRVSQGTE